MEVGDPGPPEEDVTGRLQDPLALDDPLAVLGELARLRVGLQDRGHRLLDLQHQEVRGVLALQEHDPGARAHAAHSHDLASVIDVGVLRQQVTAAG